jgi:hypothetical protein
MARRSEIGDLGLAESTPTNTEITINQNTATTHCSLWRGGFFNYEKLATRRVLSHGKKTGAVAPPDHFLIILRLGASG